MKHIITALLFSFIVMNGISQSINDNGIVVNHKERKIESIEISDFNKLILYDNNDLLIKEFKTKEELYTYTLKKGDYYILIVSNYGQFPAHFSVGTKVNSTK